MEHLLSLSSSAFSKQGAEGARAVTHKVKNSEKAARSTADTYLDSQTNIQHDIILNSCSDVVQHGNRMAPFGGGHFPPESQGYDFGRNTSRQDPNTMRLIPSSFCMCQPTCAKAT